MQIFAADRPVVRQAEIAAEHGDARDVLAILRQLSALDFGMFHLFLPDPEFPHLSRVLPRMVSADIQRAWTGAEGYDLFRQTKDFVLRLQLHFQTIAGRPLRGATILDYGCGWGRIARMMAYYTDPEHFFAVDPLVQSIDICREHGVLGQLAVSDYLPTSLPVGAARFDLIYSYSVFTHTSPRATLAALRAMRRHIKPDGVLILTVRPVEVWNAETFGENEVADQAQLIETFERTGFSFLPNVHMRTDGESTYGVTAVSPRWIAENAAGWRLVGQDRGEDHLQLLLFLTPW